MNIYMQQTAVVRTEEYKRRRQRNQNNDRRTTSRSSDGEYQLERSQDQRICVRHSKR